MIFNMTLLPPPLLPRTTRVSLSRTSMLTPRSIGRSSKLFQISRIVIIQSKVEASMKSRITTARHVSTTVDIVAFPTPAEPPAT